ncbi:MAG: CDP-glycerol glycerophosphotransferase family protein [Propionibacteriaceae bacterium]|jgi:hypothetical protein|nr:CDP-glycerol glycerophosphotransferase family protein [Propionibacteriaceae bacterium]
MAAMLGSSVPWARLLVKAQIPGFALKLPMIVGIPLWLLLPYTGWVYSEDLLIIGDGVMIGLTLLSLAASVALSLIPNQDGYRPQLTGQFAAVRLMAAMVAALTTTMGRQLSWPAIPILAWVLVASVAAEPVYAKLATVLPFAANIPGWEYSLPPRGRSNAVYWLHTAAIAQLLLYPWESNLLYELDNGQHATLAAALGPYFLLEMFTQALIAVAVGYLLVMGVRVGLYQLKKAQFERALPKLLKELAPKFVFHWHAPRLSAYQVKMWLPYLDRIGEPYFIVVRDRFNFEDIKGLTAKPVLLRDALDELGPVICKSLKAVFYVNTAIRNDHMIHYHHLKHIQLNHGDSDKTGSFTPMFRIYDYNFVAGQAAIDRFADNGIWVPPEYFRIVGRPQVEDVQHAAGPISAIANPRVLYTPTWSGFHQDADYCSLPHGLEIVRGLLERGCHVIFRPHPFTSKNERDRAAAAEIAAVLEQDRKASGREHVFGEVAETIWSVFDCFNHSDALVSDVSSVVNDYLFSGKPYAMTAVNRPIAGFADEFPVAKAAYLIDCAGKEIPNLPQVLDDLLSADPLAPTRAELKTYYLGDIPDETYADRFLEEARALLR